MHINSLYVQIRGYTKTHEQLAYVSITAGIDSITTEKVNLNISACSQATNKMQTDDWVGCRVSNTPKSI